MKKKLVFVESNTTGTGEIFINYCKIMGFQPVLLTNDISRYSNFFKKNVTVIEASTNKIDEVIEICKNLNYKNSGLVGITSSSQYYIYSAAVVANFLDLPGPNPLSIKTALNKYILKKKLSDNNIPTPKFVKVDSASDAKEYSEKFDFPVVVKPVLSSGSEGVKLCYSPSEVFSHSKNLLKIKKNSRGQKNPLYVLIEEFAIGDEYSVESIGDHNINIVGITKKYVSKEPYFVEIGHDYPAILKKKSENKIIELTKSALKTLELDWGPSHTEIRLTKDGPKIIEINPRLAGGMIPKLVKLSQGIDLIKNSLNLAIGEKISDSEKNYNFYTSIRFLIPYRNGRIKYIKGLNRVMNYTSIEEIKIYDKIKNFDKLNHNFNDRIGHIISKNREYIESRNVIEEALNEIRIVQG